MPDESDINQLLQQAQQMQQQLMEAQAAAAAQVVEGQAGGGVVKVRVTGGLDFLAVEIDPSAVDPADFELLEDLVLAAVKDAVTKAHEVSKQALGGLGGVLG